jgi:hypothetical protein
MTTKIIWKQTEGLNAGNDATTIPIDKDIVAELRPEVANMTNEEYIQFIIEKDIMPHNPEDIRIITN